MARGTWQLFRRGAGLVVCAGWLVYAGASTALAASPFCDRLQSQIASLSRGDPGKAASYSRAAQKQQNELDRTSAYANSIGCSNRKFLFFGSSPPPQCGAIDAQIQRMRGNLQGLQAQADAAQGGNSALIADLNYRYNSQCREQPRVANNAPARSDGLFGALFGNSQPQRYEQLPLDPPPRRDPEYAPAEPDAPQRGGSKAVCVRTCDGSFFPVSYSARSRNLDDLGDLCHALCPNAEVKLYTMSTGGEIEDAVSADGDAYTDLPNALKYRKAFDKTCTCKAAGQSWVAALAEAERVLGQTSRNDILVTPQKADELARPNLTPRGKTLAKGKAGAGELAAEEVPVSAIIPSSPPIAGELPLVSGAMEQQYREITGPDGIKRRVRIVGPTR